MLIEHTNRSTEDKPKICVLVRYGGQQDASTSKVSIRSANQKCHTTLSDSYTSQPKVNAVPVNGQRKTAAAKSQRSRSKSTVNLDFCANKCGLQKSEF